VSSAAAVVMAICAKPDCEQEAPGGPGLRAYCDDHQAEHKERLRIARAPAVAESNRRRAMVRRGELHEPGPFETQGLQLAQFGRDLDEAMAGHEQSSRELVDAEAQWRRALAAMVRVTIEQAKAT